MRVTFLGSGGAFADHRVNYHNNALIDVGDTRVLLDCGTTACQSLRELEISPTSIDAVAFTHLHADHASPEQLAWERMYSGPSGVPAGLRTPLLGPRDLLDPLGRSLRPFMGIWRDLSGTTRTDGVEAVLDARPADSCEEGPLRLDWFRVPHVDGHGITKDAFGITLTTEHKRVLWSGDTTFSPAWIRRAFETGSVDVLFHECTFSERFDGTVHTHYTELLSLPDHIRARIVLMHHTAVPDHEDPVSDGFLGAADRHEVFDI